MFEADAITLGLLAAFVIGLSKTGLPGGGLVAIPLLATVFDGRLIAGGTLPILIAADLFAVAWYRRHARWDVLRSLAPWIGAGYVVGIAFFVAVGDAPDTIARTVGGIVLAIVALQAIRMARGAEPTTASPSDPVGRSTAATHGTTAGFTTFVANAAGPVINSYLLRQRLPKAEIIGTSAWLYLTVNVSKIPLYLALGELSDGGRFFTADSLLFDLAVVPGVFAGVLVGRVVFRLIPQGAFAVIVIVLSALGALRLVV